MIIAQKYNDVIVDGDNTSKKATINQDKLGKLQYLLTAGLYQDPISAVIVEWTNNAVDSVVQSGKDPIEYPVIVEIQNLKLRIQDNGTGLSKDEFENICMSYLTSTKENDNNSIGHFGIGLKSFLSLERSATFTCRKDGKEVKFLAYAGVEFMEYDVIYEKDTTEENGVICELDIKDWSEERVFTNKAKLKLSYYDTVVLKINSYIVNNVITRSDDWQSSNNCEFSVMHLCLKDVLYEINWSSLGISPIYFPVALRFGLNENITPTPSRESLIYNTATKQAILEKIKKVANWFVDRYNSNWKQYDTILECWSKITETDKKVEIAGNNFVINSILSYSDNKPKELSVKGIKRELNDYYKLKNELLKEYEIVVDCTNYYWKTKKIKWVYSHSCLLSGQKVIQVNSVPVGRVKRYLLEKHKGKLVFVVKNQTRKLGSRRFQFKREVDYIYCLGLYNHSKSEWRSIIQEWQYVENQFKERIIDERNVENTKEYQEWLEKDREIARENRKNGYKNPKSNYKALNKQEGDITISVGRKGYTSSGVTFDKKVFKIEKLGNLYNSSKNLHIYFKEEDKERAAKYFKTFGKKYTICIIGKRESGKIKNNKQFMNEEQFLGSTKFGKLMSAIKYEEAIDTYDNLKNNKIVKEVLKSFYKDYEIVEKYVDDNIKEVDESLMTILQEVADKGNIYDKSIEDVYIRFKDSLKKYDFIDCLKVPNYWNSQETDKYRRLINCMLLTKSKYNNYENLDIIVEAKKEEELEEATV